MKIYPAIDILDGECVRLTEGDYNRVDRYQRDPIEVAKSFADQGATFLHVVDLDGARSGLPVNLALVESIVKAVPMAVQVGGGIRDAERGRDWLLAGVDRFVMGTALTQDRSRTKELFDEFGTRLVAGVDTKEGLVATHGWTSTESLLGVTFVQDLALVGCRAVVFTDVAKDGVLSGPNVEATAALVKAVPGVEVVASGGVSCLADLDALRTTGCAAVIIGKAIYEGRFTLAQALESEPTLSA